MVDVVVASAWIFLQWLRVDHINPIYIYFMFWAVELHGWILAVARKQLHYKWELDEPADQEEGVSDSEGPVGSPVKRRSTTRKVRHTLYNSVPL